MKIIIILCIYICIVGGLVYCTSSYVRNSSNNYFLDEALGAYEQGLTKLQDECVQLKKQILESNCLIILAGGAK